ncbi:Crotonobetainyl-CoA:carnitine CoA-transferase CaiB and related acyl-CoA transferase [Pseudomonas syringae pv. actinidiae]|uniref:Crotonobetainyl-CoA:carnitine CoA-transferase CaiB and related acyl-CoA transferase n=1 Tax=Pseudomonas syringae pv. actinidiae TaxID=103796 RepID=A0AAN4Q7H4_PSESF|nr:Crotonobetainyl-CoA:carnitine CoA-transferase CaiB and related acyl-CoA transferase [Pseudomonas syringae pv. actinidiae]
MARLESTWRFELIENGLPVRTRNMRLVFSPFEVVVGHPDLVGMSIGETVDLIQRDRFARFHDALRCDNQLVGYQANRDFKMPPPLRHAFKPASKTETRQRIAQQIICLPTDNRIATLN